MKRTEATNSGSANQMPRIEPRAVSVEEAACAIGLSRSLTYELVARGELRTIKVGARRLVPVAALDEFVRNRSGDQ